MALEYFKILVHVGQDVVETQGAVASNLVRVYKSLGGGCKTRQGKTVDELLPESTRTRDAATHQVLEKVT